MDSTSRRPMAPSTTQNLEHVAPLPSSFPRHVSPVIDAEVLEGKPPREMEYSGIQELPQTISPSSPQPLQQPHNFASYFTLIEDSTTGEHHHPSVHYIFADDDQDVVTDALIHTLTPDSTTAPGKGQDQAYVGGGSSAATNKLRERYLIVDIAPSGQQIVAAKSLAADWQILDTTMTPAPTFDGSAGADGGAGGLLLKVEGLEVNVDAAGPDYAEHRWNQAKEKNGGDAWGALKSLEEKIQREIEVLKRLEATQIVSSGGHAGVS